jgi:hypothetical protein
VIDVKHEGGHKMEKVLDGLKQLTPENSPIDVPPEEIQNTF